jgi:formylglycine-generating enzyme required for sulfatase activity
MSIARNAILVLVLSLVWLFPLLDFPTLSSDAHGEDKENTVGNEPKAGEEREFEIADGVKMTFCWIPLGESQLGSPKEEQDYITKTYYNGRRPDDMDNETEAKRGKFKTKGFWLGKFTVTQAEWKAVMNYNPSGFNGEKDNKAKGLETSRFPVENISWHDCQIFFDWVNKREGIEKVFGRSGKFMLPHEDQWEYACRGGKGNKQPFYWGDELNATQANCDENQPYGTQAKGLSLGRTCAVDFMNGGKFPKHPWGLCHMSGNVFQWCENWYEPTKRKLIRGGSWIFRASLCRSANRCAFAPDLRSKNIGFRVCLTLEN